MANFKITATTTVAELKEQFHNEFGGILRVYQGRSEAPEDATLVSLGGKVGELECRASRTVGKFIEAFQSELGLKVKVYTKDNWVSVLDGITLATVREIPKNARKAQMKQFLAYQRDEEEEAEETSTSSQIETKPTDLRSAYEDCEEDEIDLSNLDTSEATSMCNMFSGCRNISKLDLSNFNTSKVEDMDSMFYGCEGLLSLDLSSFDTSNVKYMPCMFSCCKNIQELDLSNFDVSNVEDFTGMFENMTWLGKLNLSNWKVREDANFCDFLSGENDLRYIIAKNCSQNLIDELKRRARGVDIITE